MIRDAFGILRIIFHTQTQLEVHVYGVIDF